MGHGNYTGYTFLGVISSKTMLKFALDMPFSKYSTKYVVAMAMPIAKWGGFGNAKSKKGFFGFGFAKAQSIFPSKFGNLNCQPSWQVNIKGR